MERKVNDSNKALFQRKPGFRDRVRTSMFALTLKSLPIALGFVLEASAVKFMGFDSLLAEARGKRLVADGTVPTSCSFCAGSIPIRVKCPRLLYQSQCKFSVDDSAGMRSGAGDGV